MALQSSVPPPPLLPEDPALAYRRMKRVATGLFLAMATLFVASKYFEASSPILPFVRAFAEAAMVGALADWFAVTALFRRPLGLPIPHTAIVPRSKDRIGAGLGRFISRNFLQPDQVQRRLKDIDLAGSAASWLTEGDRARRIAHGLAGAVPRVLGLLNEGKIAAWLQSTLTERLRHADIAHLLAEGLDMLIRGGRHKPIVDLIIFHADLAIHSEETTFRSRVSNKMDWLPKLFAVDAAASDALLTAIKDTLKDAAKDPNHTMRTRIDEALAHLARDLRHDPNLRDGLQRWIREVADHDVVRTYVTQIWNDLKKSLKDQSPEETERLATALAAGLQDLARALDRDEELRESLNLRLKAWAVELADAQGEGVGRMVAETIQGWDARTVVDQIEAAVGRDLQYIRISGTLIGGLVGLTIHTLSLWLFPVK
ncbi:hypothetical protein PbB2_00834 [Candidatus Phycosocius bacilliformis]|uniref:DUF445 domain-containing protein n=1 Tax=Candidatus Phycosocius bacilliformis TaxID=1445552 RepID=A0A2P2E809_9PROT|nr:DUF445 domain-containing protein [Candidatus Phycosocius bacilliformis]GBF57174.1 hypothetical protein PbB2_00834 [Candidatus Phycosocius bacilliformis]